VNDTERNQVAEELRQIRRQMERLTRAVTALTDTLRPGGGQDAEVVDLLKRDGRD
jgi:hypothetical protein